MGTHVVVPKDLVESIDSTVGRGARSRFLVEAAEEKLARIRRLKAFSKVAGSLASVDIPGWETSEGAAAWVSASRRADEDHLRARTEGR
jgi:hypothetical protein